MIFGGGFLALCLALALFVDPSRKATTASEVPEPVVAAPRTLTWAELVRLDSVPESQRGMARDAFSAVLDACPPLRVNYERSTRRVDLSLADESSGCYGHCGRGGWKKAIVAEVRLGETENVQTSGHTLQFIIGGGKRPGFFFTKDVVALLCNAGPRPSGGDGFKAVEQLKEIMAAL